MKKFFLLIALFIAGGQLPAQNYPDRAHNPRPVREKTQPGKVLATGLDIGLNIGTAHSLADIGGTRNSARILFLDAQWQATGMNLGLYARYRFSPIFAFAAEISHATIKGADKYSPSTSSRYNRGYSFENNIYEFAVKGEFYLPARYNHLPVDFFAFAGLGLISHNPVLTGAVAYQPDPFNKLQPVIPLGIGVHHTFAGNLRLGYRLGWRKTFTDHLDALSTQNSNGNDSYFFNSLSVGYFFSK